MKRRDFLKSMTAVAAGSLVSAPAVWSPAQAQSRKETLLLVTENGPNNLDIHGVGTNRPGYEASWNTYDRLLSHAKKTLPDGTTSYDRDKLTPELAEDWTTGDITATFKLRKVDLQRQGYDPRAFEDPLYVIDEGEQRYVPYSEETLAKAGFPPFAP